VIKKENLKYVKNLSSIHRKNDDIIYAIVMNSKVIKSSDNGISWEVLISEYTNSTLNSIFFTTPTVGIVVGNDGTVLRTHDGGISWMEIEISDNCNLNSVYFLNDKIGYIIGDKGAIFKTTCGGLEWKKIEINYSSNLNEIIFNNVLNGYIVGEKGLILKTIDGGTNWLLVDSGTNKNLLDIKFTNTGIGYVIGGKNILLKTNDNGISWTKQDTKINDYFYEIEILDKTVIIQGSKNHIYKNIGDDSWKSLNSISAKYISKLNLIDNFDGTAIGAYDYKIEIIRKTLQWNKLDISSKELLNDVYFINKDTGFVVGENGSIFKTTNSGQDWKIQNSGTKNELCMVHFKDSNNGYIYGSGGKTFKTMDGGNNWVKMNSEALDLIMLDDNYFVNDAVGYRYSDLDSPYRKSNQTIKFYDSFLDQIHSNELYHIFFPNKKTGYAVGEGGKKYKTSDGGEEWIQLDSKSEFEGLLQSIYFIDAQIGFCIGYSNLPIRHGIIQMTTDGGDTWKTTDLNLQFDLKSIQFVDDQIGFIVGDSNIVLKTIDGGKSWKYELFEGSGLVSIVLINKNLGYALDNDGLIWKLDPMKELSKPQGY